MKKALPLLLAILCLACHAALAENATPTDLHPIAEDSIILRRGVPVMAEANTTYVLTASTDPELHLNIDVWGVRVELRGASLPASVLDATVPFDLVVESPSELTGDTPLDWAYIFSYAPLTLRAPVGSHTVFRDGHTVLSQPPAGYSAYVTGFSNYERLRVDGRLSPLMTLEGGAVLLAVPEEGRTYTFSVKGSTLVAASYAQQSDWHTSEGIAVDAGNLAAFSVSGGEGYATGSVTAGGNLNATAEFNNVQLSSPGPVLTLNSECLTLTLHGDNGLVSEVQTIELDEASSLQLTLAEGRLLLRRQVDLTGITLAGNIKVEPRPEEQKTFLVRNRNGNPLPNRAVTVRLGDESYSFITHYDATLCLWNMDGLDSMSVEADGEACQVSPAE